MFLPLRGSYKDPQCLLLYIFLFNKIIPVKSYQFIKPFYFIIIYFFLIIHVCYRPEILLIRCKTTIIFSPLNAHMLYRTL